MRRRWALAFWSASARRWERTDFVYRVDLSVPARGAVVETRSGRDVRVVSASVDTATLFVERVSGS